MTTIRTALAALAAASVLAAPHALADGLSKAERRSLKEIVAEARADAGDPGRARSGGGFFAALFGGDDDAEAAEMAEADTGAARQDAAERP